MDGEPSLGARRRRSAGSSFPRRARGPSPVGRGTAAGHGTVAVASGGGPNGLAPPDRAQSTPVTISADPAVPSGDWTFDSHDELVASWTPRALALARRLLADHALAEDVVQEAFLAYWRNPASFDPARGAFGSWLLAMVHHKAVDAVRHEESQRRRLAAVGAWVAAHSESAPDVADDVADRMAGLQVRRALEKLPAGQREAIVLTYWGGYTQVQIAQRTGVPLGTVKTRILAAKRGLQKALSNAALPVLPGQPMPRVAG